MISWHTLLTLLLFVYAAAHLYLYRRVRRAWGPLGRGALWTLRAATVVLALTFPLTHRLLRGPAGPIAVATAWLAAAWVGTLLYLFLVTLILHGATALARAVGWLPRTVPPRRARLAVAAVAGAGLLIAAWGALEARRGAAPTTLEYELPNLPAALDGFTVVQVTDIHFGPFFGERRLRDLVRRIDALSPDLVVITGDLVDGPESRLDLLSAPLRELRARCGVLAIAGNHDAMAGVARVVAAAQAGGVRYLRNERITVDGALTVWGVDDPAVARHGFGPGPPLGTLIGPEAATLPSLLLCHRPDRLDEAAARGVGLVLSGHTHGGQMWPLTYVSGLFYPCQHGLYRRGATAMFVSRGVGTWGPPLRLAAPPEIVKIRLRAAG